MKPDVNQHLQSMAKALTEIVLPELQDKPFALEQTSLVIASLKLLCETQSHQFAYAQQEHDDASRLLSAWYITMPTSGTRAFWQEVFGDARPSSALDFATLSLAVSEQKARICQLLQNDLSSAPAGLQALVRQYIDRQLARETSSLRLTGFIPNAEQTPAIGEVLATQKKQPLPATPTPIFTPHH